MLRSTKECILAAPQCASRAFRSLTVQVFDDFGVPLWRPFWITFWHFGSFEASQIMFGFQAWFLMTFEWNICWFMTSQPFKSIVNSNVFIRCHIFQCFMNLRILGACLDLILDTLGDLGAPILWFLGVLEIPWNLIDFQDHPKLREPGCWVVNWCTRGTVEQS